MTQPFSKQLSFVQQNLQYRGRFAPSPSGPLHFGSLVAALGSYLQAKKQQGLWFVRIEDIDKPRERPGAVTAILEGLEAFGLNWDIDANTQNWLQPDDRNCLVQSRRQLRYQQVFDWLQEQNLLYACQCTRKQLKALGGIYNNACRPLQLAANNCAIRLKQTQVLTQFTDRLFNKVSIDPAMAAEDYIIKRRDSLFAYQLVVVIDDIDQGITEVVRGADIMSLTPRQISLFNLFAVPAPSYLHLPLASSQIGFKLSKQNHAAPLNVNNPKPELIQALEFLGLPTKQQLDLQSGSLVDILQWATEHWQMSAIPAQREILVSG